jgi:hypothetical protein
MHNNTDRVCLSPARRYIHRGAFRHLFIFPSFCVFARLIFLIPRAVSSSMKATFPMTLGAMAVISDVWAVYGIEAGVYVGESTCVVSRQ